MVPPLQKMSTERQLLGLYAAGAARWRTAAREPPASDREPRTAEGGSASALDADSEGVEGKYDAWTPAELVGGARTRSDGGWARPPRGHRRGTFQQGRPPSSSSSDPRARAGDGCADVHTAEAARDERSGRRVTTRSSRPGTGWRSAARATPDVARRLRCTSSAAAAAGELLTDFTWRGRGGCCLSHGTASGRQRGCWRTTAARGRASCCWPRRRVTPARLDRAGSSTAPLEHFAAEDDGFFDTADDAETLVARPRDPGDNASPSGFSSMATRWSPRMR